MARVLSNRIIFLTVLVAMIGFIFYASTSFFLQDRFLTSEVHFMLQKKLQGTGLQISIAKIHWAGLNRITASGIVLKDLGNNSLPFKIHQIDFHLDLLTLLINRIHPEAAFKEIELIKPRIQLQRFPDNTWNFDKYFTLHKHLLQLQTAISINEGCIELQDFRYGHYVLQKVAGKVIFNKYPLLNWDLHGTANFNERLKWASQGKCRIDQPVGIGEFTAENIAVSKIAAFLPRSNRYHISSGYASVNFSFAWTKEGVWLKKGSAALSDVAFLLPQIKDPFIIKQMVAEFSPLQCRVSRAYVIHQQTTIKVAGTVNIKNSLIRLELSAEQVNLADIQRLLSITKGVSLQGETDLRIAVTGTINAPLIDGELFVNNARLMAAGEKIQQISGRITIRDNNLKIERLEGNWNNSLLGVSGNIYQLFTPKLDLKLYGFGLNLQPGEMAELQRLGLKVAGTVNFEAKIGGEPTNPKIIGEISCEKLFWQDTALNNLKIQLEWDRIAESLKIQEIQGDLWEGHLQAKGEIRVNQKGAKWQISGQIADLNMNKSKLGARLGINGKISSDLIFKGSWRRGTPLQFGSVLGIFKGEKLVCKDAVVDEITGVFNLMDNNLNIDSIQAKIGVGNIYGHLSWNSSNLLLQLNAENVPLQQLLPDNKKYPLEGIFNGNFLFSGPLAEMTGKINGVLNGVTWGGKSVGTISGSIDYQGQKLNIIEASVATDTSNYYATGQINLTGKPQVALQVTSDSAQLKDLIKWLPVASSLKLDGIAKINCAIAGRITNPNIHGELSLIDPVIGPLQLDQGTLKVDGNLHELSILEFNLSKLDSQISMNGKISKDQLDLNINGSSLQLDRLGLAYGGKVLSGKINLQGKIIGPAQNPTLTATVSGQGLSFQTFYFQKLAAQVTCNSRVLTINSALLSQDQTLISLKGNMAITKSFPLNLTLNVTDLSLKKLLDNIGQMPADFAAEGKLSGLVNLTGNLANPEIRMNGDLSQGVINTFPVTGEFDFTYNNHQVFIQKFLLSQGTGVLLATGLWEVGQLGKIEIGLQNFPCQVMNPFIKPSYKLAGVANAFLYLEWSNSKIAGEYHLLINNLFLNDNGLGDLSASGSISNQGITVANGTLSQKGSLCTIKGDIPWLPGLLPPGLKVPIATESQSRNLNIALDLKNFPAELANILLPSLTVSNGTLDGEFKLGGTLTEPTTVGKIETHDVAFHIVGLTHPIEDFNASVFLAGSRVTFKRARGNYYKGKFDLSGYFEYKGLKVENLNLNLIGEDIYYNNSYFDGYGDLNLKLNGPLKNSTLSGDITINNSKINIPLDNKKGTLSAWDPNLNLTIHTGENVSYRQIGLADATLEGTIQAQGKLSNPRIEGEIDSQRGTLTLYGQTFKVNQGKATFKYSQGYLPYIDINSSMRTSQTEIFLTAKGQVGNNIAIDLTSQPYMSRSDLYALINWPDPDNRQQLLTVNDEVTGTSIITDTILGGIFSELQSALNINYLYLEPNYVKDNLQINVGLSKDWLLSYNRSFTVIQKDSWGLDYRVNSEVSLGGDFSDFEGTSWQLLYHFTF